MQTDLDELGDGFKALLAEVRRLRADRERVIGLLENKLDALRGDGNRPGCRKPPKKTTTPKKVPDPPAKAPCAAKTPVGDKIVRKDGRSFTKTAKVARARKLQGQYLGNLRQIPKKERAKFQKIAREQSVAEALAAIKKRLGK